MAFKWADFARVHLARIDKRTPSEREAIAVRVAHYAALVREKGRIGDGWLSFNPAAVDKRYGTNQPVIYGPKTVRMRRATGHSNL